MIAVFDYGSGNLRSVLKAFQHTGKKVVVTNEAELAKTAQALVIPGVGAFSACMSSLYKNQAREIIDHRISNQSPIFGICVGLQVLFSESEEKSDSKTEMGLSIWPNKVVKLSNPILPHIGWNMVETGDGTKLLKGLDGEKFYFVHSYAVVEAAGEISSWCNYGQRFLAAVEDGPVVATQFHPEKSGSAGLRIISNWVDSL